MGSYCLMKCFWRQVFTAIFLFIFCAAMPALRADEQARQILDAARLNQVAGPATLNGRLRVENNKIPFQLILEKNTVEYQFENPDQAIILDFSKKLPRLLEKTGRKTSTVIEGKYDKKIRNSDITYEDIGMRFMNWPDPVLAGEDTVRTRKTWKIDIPAPDTNSQYANVRVWIDKENGALMRMEGYDPSGNLLKRFEVISVQKLQDRWVLKQMRIEAFDPATRKITSRTYLEITDML